VANGREAAGANDAEPQRARRPGPEMLDLQDDDRVSFARSRYART
jgi:hypothetical protein